MASTLVDLRLPRLPAKTLVPQESSDVYIYKIIKTKTGFSFSSL